MKTLALAAIFVSNGWASAQSANPHYELAWRLRELDREWAKHNTPEEHAKALPAIEDAAQLWLSGDVLAAAELIDDARTKLDGKLDLLLIEADELVDGHGVSIDGKRLREIEIGRDGMRIALTPVTRLCDKNQLGVALSNQPLYGAGRPSSRWCGICDEGYFKARERALHPSLSLSDLSEGDHSVPCHVSDPDFGELQRVIAISLVSNRDARLAALETAVAGLSQRAPQLERETARASLTRLKALAIGASNTCDYPGARLLAETESVVAAATKGESWYGTQRSGDFSIVVPLYKSPNAHVRVLAPSGLTRGKPQPLLLALHGEGADENSLLERSDGALARECERRGWLVVAPRLEPETHLHLGLLLQTLNETWPFDVTRVFVLGYSSGALAGLALADDAPSWIRGFAAIGGGRGIRGYKLANRDFLCIAGERDFGRFGVERLHQSLVDAGSQTATLKIYPNTEHLMVIADAIPEVLALFDELAK